MVSILAPELPVERPDPRETSATRRGSNLWWCVVVRWPGRGSSALSIFLGA
ncbi:hypothetical protein RchiOBHm_Chr5g0020801 [Rosa chinensis]|uniref:Uncharacterized protein n=1 Tax=Rosa chinensis TaxID=74649 RepID=A0A2P6Q7E4_ROSCH|nr:hypothetical protein RchiOBHm_Chr5g0020801 [Rosa chinensis]